MWISNTATAAMMFPIGLSIVAHLTHGRESLPASRNFAIAMMLMAAFGANIGGIGTPIGTPPNLIGKGMLERIAHVEISFVQWMVLGVPCVVIVFLFLVLYFRWRLLGGLVIDPERTQRIHEELRRLGPMTRAQRNTLVAFAITVALWLFPGVLAVVGLGETAFARGYDAALPESIAAMIGAVLLFLMPVNWRARRFTLTWEQAVRIDWGIILLFGGGLAMGALAFSTGLAEAMGRGITAWLPVHSTFTLTVLFTGVAVVISETASNTASANMIVPVAIAVAQAAGVDPTEPALGATLGASMGFMMPISTPANAIVYSSGHVPITAMMRHGLVLDIAGFVVIVLIVSGLRWRSLRATLQALGFRPVFDRMLDVLRPEPEPTAVAISSTSARSSVKRLAGACVWRARSHRDTASRTTICSGSHGHLRARRRARSPSARACDARRAEGLGTVP